MIPTSAEGTMPLIQIQRDWSTTFVILDSGVRKYDYSSVSAGKIYMAS